MFATQHNPTAVLALLVGGVMLLLYGVRLTTEAMERALGARLRLAMMTLAHRPLGAFVAGVVVTTLTQSSSATVSVLVGLVSTQSVPLAAAVIMQLGAGVGSTLVVQLLTFHITDYALELLGLGAAVALWTRRTVWRDFGRATFSFGLVFVGLAMINASSAPIAESPITKAVLQALSSSPFVLALVGALLAAAFVSSTATIGLVLVLAAGGALPLTAALALTLGANVGTTLTPLLTALNRGKIAGVRLAFIYVGTRLLGALLVLVALNPLATLLTRVIPNPATQVALVHLGFNLVLAAIFVPLASQVSALATKLLPDPAPKKKFGSRYLDPEALALPSVALAQVMREILRMADRVAEMLQLSIQAFDPKGTEVPKRIRSLDKKLDNLEAEIKGYLIQLNNNLLSGEQERREISLLYISTELAAIGNVINKYLMQLARRQRRKQIAFSPEEWDDVVTYHSEVLGLLQRALAGLAAQDTTIAAEVLSQRKWLNQLKREIYLRHLYRLRSGNPSSLEASTIHLELLNTLSRVLSHTSSIAHALQGNL
ncbi:MAG: Na/Pi cotransporter family protein [Chroococcidiopsidaceae cyanobacterium CP_BM_ER_R8_30]|nr:Na/Pi cotransporter family protein [Chroococcidiopsidaceae cyanobacterium CP_BM_ER_R8_30]